MQGFTTSSSFRVASASTLSLFLTCGQASAQVHPTGLTLECGDVGDCAHWSGLPSFDVRTLPSEVPNRTSAEALEAVKKSGAWARREARLQALMGEIPQLRCDEHHLFGTPHFLRSTARFLTGPSVLAPRQVVEQYISVNSDLFEIDGKDLEGARVVRNFDTHGPMHHLTYQQTIDELKR